MPDSIEHSYGVYNSQRIVAQRGVFVCFGESIHRMISLNKKGILRR